MKILLVSEDIPAPILGGLGKHTVRLGNALIQAGHQVTLMGTRHHDYESCRAEVGFDGPFIAGFDLSGTGWKEATLGTFVPYKRPAIAGRIALAILEHASDYDVIHYHGHYPLIGRQIPASINFVQTRHDQGSECLIHVRFKQGAVCTSSDPHDCAACALNAQPGAWRRQLAAWAVKQYRTQTADAFARHKTLFVSDFLRRAFLSHVPSADIRKCSVIHNFIDTRTLPAPQSGDPAHILFVGRIDAAKGVMDLLDALRVFDDQAYRIDLIGDGPDRAACEARHAARHIRFHGWKLQSDALAETARAGRIVVPSICEESCGTTILEGLALYKPVYALARGGTPELKCYERWPGQLHLFDDMTALAKGLMQADAIMPNRMEVKPFGADIETLLPEFLRVYAL
ncbi:glycosyltransferase family 4 protein [Thiobacillus sp.]|uniref:glycosyltransferase family 4 protein n=1 Tax=Thiobacillus sp. TaxID=924 RepID=UPI0025EF95AC|nr:glycosyltransferase family 4 protein [Thiobacillus sp.]MBT9538266.1 glycosyltransferase family 4 protein [Thiobacillus sp.]